MEFINENLQNRRNIERFVLLFYSLYSILLCYATVRRGGQVWISWIMIIALIVSWFVFFMEYRSFRTRALITTLMIQMTVILHAIHTDDMVVVVPTFIVLSILIAFYGYEEFIRLSFVSVLIVAFYHGVIADTFMAASAKENFRLLSQLGNIICMEFLLSFWLKKRNENDEQTNKVIEALMDAEQSKDDFLSNVSHEIRTPVNTICGMSEMALREYEPEKIRHEVLDIRDAGRNLMSLVSDILDFSQLQQGKMDIEEESYNITSTINDIINMAMAKKGDKPIEFIVDCDAGIPSELLGDEKKIRRVILNLINNAIKFTNEGGVIVTVNARKENYGVNLCVSVKDTGIGIAEENLEKLFESFSQVDTRRNRQEGGVGLGLAISRALVHKMGGTINVRSRLGKGSIFRVVIPQKVLKEKAIARLDHREQLNIAAYFDMEQFDMMAIRDEYTNLIIHMVKQLQVRCHVCRNLTELKRRETQDPFSHVFISLEEYQEDESYFDQLAKHTKVAIVIDRPNEQYISNPDLIRLYKPFYILPVISILNGNSGAEGGRQVLRAGKFTAPDAHVLVVDDNQMNIRVIEGILKEYQIQVSYATSGHEAIEVIENMSYDFVFMDHMMPEMDGIETLHRIRNKVGSYYRKVPIIALTANAAPGNREMFLEEGFDDFLEKPVEISVLERVLKRNLPEEKLIFQTENSVEVSAAKDIKAHSEPELLVGDLDVRQGILYCGGRRQYLNILKAYYEEGEEKCNHLDQLYQKQDWKNYTIQVHALKSTMKSIGALPLFEKAKSLETAGKNKDTDYILQNHEDMILEHQRVMEALKQCPQIQSEQPEPDSGDEKKSIAKVDSMEQAEEWMDLPELSEEHFDRLLTELENAVFSFDEEQMLTIVEELQGYQYHHSSMVKELDPVKKKIEMSDYMPALDMVSGIRNKLL